VAVGRDLSGEITRFIVAEIQNQLAPLALEVRSQGKTIRSLYANGSGGPPGYLEMARAEDKQAQKDFKREQDRLVEVIKKIDERMDKVDGFMIAHEASEKRAKEDREAADKLAKEEREKAAAALATTVQASDRKFKRFIAIWSLVIMIFMALIALYDHRGAIAHTLEVAPPDAHSEYHAPQDATLPKMR